MTNADDNALRAQAASLVAQFRTVLMATCNLAGEPEASYTPYCLHDGLLYIFISDLSLHTGNLLANPRASLLFIEDESASSNLHARKRASFSVTAEEVDRSSQVFDQVLDVMQQRFGEIIAVLKSLPDFHLFAMRPASVNLVLGFAQAHNLECTSFHNSSG